LERLIANIDVSLVSQIGSNITINLSFPAYINGLSNIVGTFTNLTTSSTLGTISAVQGNSINATETIHIGDIFEYELRFVIAGQDDAYATCWIEYGSDVTPQEVSNLTTSTNSFVTFDGTIQDECNDSACFCLPAYSMDEINNQFQIDAEGLGWNKQDLIDILNGSPTTNTTFWAMICEDCTPPSSVDITDYHGALVNWQDAGSGNTSIASTITWQSIGNSYFNSLPKDHSFKICIIKRADDGAGGFENTLIGCSDQCFTKITDTCFTSLMYFSSNDDSFCFYYDATGYSNIIRLPIVLRNPQSKQTTKGYQKSNGTFVKLSERISKIFAFEVGNVDESTHDKIATMLAHDNVSITNDRFDAETIYCEDDYVVNWSEDVVAFNLVTASTKVYISKDSCLTNSNC
jgi:hypothetical protein